MSRRLFLAGGLCATLGSPWVRSAANEVNVLRVFFPPGGVQDTFARALARVIEAEPEFGKRYIVENLSIPRIAAERRMPFRSGKGLYILTGDTLKRLQLETRVQFRGFFSPLLSLGRTRTALVSSQFSGISSIGDLRRFRGRARVLAAKDCLAGATKQLAAQFLIAQFAPSIDMQFVSGLRASPLRALSQDELDFAVGDIDAIDPRRQTASLMLSRAHSKDPAGLVGSMERFVGNLPTDDEVFVCVDRSWPDSAASTLSRDLRRVVSQSREVFAREIPSLQPSTLTASQAQQYLGSFSYGLQLCEVRPDIYTECAPFGSCTFSGLPPSAATRVAMSQQPKPLLPDCLPGGGRPALVPVPGVDTPENPPGCLDPRVASTQEEPKSTSESKSWWEQIIDFFKLAPKANKELEAAKNEDWDALDRASKDKSSPAPSQDQN